MTITPQQLVEERAIEHLLNRYARACDERDWEGLAQVFSADASVNYGNEFKLAGRPAIVSMVRSMLGGCGPTQHLLGNFDIAIDGDVATCVCYVRAAHAGRGEMRGEFYEVWAEYRDVVRKEKAQWQIISREMVVHQEVGARAVLAPEPRG